jgi:hypothetical protein
MTSRYPRERDEVDRKKRRAADTTHFLFVRIHSLEKTSYPRGVLFIREIALDSGRSGWLSV